MESTWESVRKEFFQDGCADSVVAWRSASVDRIVETQYCTLLSTASVALLAVGGYGRRELFPYSDVDLLLLFENDRAIEDSKQLISPFLQNLWDAGLRVSHSVRTPAECAELHDGNTELNISLLDTRFLAGNERIFAELNRQAP